MATKKGNVVSEQDLTQAQESINDLAVTGNAGLTFDQAFEIFEQAEDKMLHELAADYFRFEKKGETFNFIIDGFSEITIDGKTAEVVKMRDKDGNQLINGDKVLVSSAKRLGQLPAFVRVFYAGDVKVKQGTYKDLKVKTFPLPTA